MNLIREIKYRWNNGCASLPGELEPLDSPEGQIRVLYSTCGEDNEPIQILRRFRGLLGYGPGWTFIHAVRQSLITIFVYAFPLIVIFIVAFIITCIQHSH